MRSLQMICSEINVTQRYALLLCRYHFTSSHLHICLLCLRGKFAVVRKCVERGHRLRVRPPSSCASGGKGRTAVPTSSMRLPCWSSPPPAPTWSTSTPCTRWPRRWCWCWNCECYHIYTHKHITL